MGVTIFFSCIVFRALPESTEKCRLSVGEQFVTTRPLSQRNNVYTDGASAQKVQPYTQMNKVKAGDDLTHALY